MKLLYIAAPYRAKTICSLQQNIHEAKLMSMYYWKKGYAVICPHLNSANFDGLLNDKTFLHGSMLMLSKCDAIAMHPNWRDSTGCIEENSFAVQYPGIEILYPDWDDILTILDELYREG